jgi:dTDP-glucose 4,6-dehydratase
VAHAICDAMDRLAPRGGGQSHRALVTIVPDRPRQDFRYAIDCAKMKAEFGWAPKNSFESGLALTVLRLVSRLSCKWTAACWVITHRNSPD